MSYTGKILRVDLTEGKIGTENPPDLFYRTFLGGRGLIAHYLCKELEPTVRPLDPENLLIFAPGVLTGAPFAGSGRHSVGALSPLTHGFGNGEAGGFWGTELKRAGIDAILIRGSSPKSCYLWIEDDRVEIRDGTALRGKTTVEVDQSLRQCHGPSVRIAQCGPAGEHLVPFACVTHDLRHFVGRTGMGAVMGSKNLRALVVKGSGHVPVADREKMMPFLPDFRSLLQTAP